MDVRRVVVRWDDEEYVYISLPSEETDKESINHAIQELFYSIADAIGFYDAHKQRVYLYSKSEDVIDDCYQDERYDTYKMLAHLQFWKSDVSMFREFIRESDLISYLFEHKEEFLTLEVCDLDSLGEDGIEIRKYLEEQKQKAIWETKIANFETAEAQDKVWGE